MLSPCSTELGGSFGTPSPSSSGCQTPRSKLDSLSREDLIRFVKKQVTAARASAQRAADLEKELTNLEKSRLEKQGECEMLREELELWKDDCKSKSEELANLKAQFVAKDEEFHSQKEVLENQILLLEKQLSFCKEESNLKDGNLDNKYQEECQVLRDALNERAALCDELARENERQCEQLSLLESSSSPLREKLREVELEKEQLARRLTDAEQFEANVEELKGTLANYQAELEKEQKERESILKANRSLANEVAELKRTVSVLNKANNERESADLESIKVSRNEFEQLKLQNGNLHYDLMKRTSECEVLSQVIEGANDKAAQMKKENDELQRNFSEVQNQLAFVEQELSLALRKDDFVRSSSAVQTDTMTLLCEPSATWQTDESELNKQLERKDEELENQKIELNTLKRAKEDQRALIDSMSSQLAQRQADLDKGKNELDDLKTNLDALKESSSKEKVLNLEMADYERSFEQLNEQVSNLNELVDSKSNENASLNKELESVRSQKAKLEATTGKLKSALVKSRKDLAVVKKEGAEKQTLISDLQGRLDRTTSQLEEIKLDLSNNLTTNERRLRQFESSQTQLERTVDRLEADKRTITYKLTSVQDEFSEYKVVLATIRVHTVLKEQQSSSASQKEETFMEERSEYKREVEELRQKLAESAQANRSLVEELRAFREQSVRIEAKCSALEAQRDELTCFWQSKFDNQCTAFEARLAKTMEANRQLKLDQDRIAAAEEVAARRVEREAKHTAETVILNGRVEELENELMLLRMARQQSAVQPSSTPPPVHERKPAEGSENGCGSTNQTPADRGRIVDLPIQQSGPYRHHGSGVLSPTLDELIASDQYSLPSNGTLQQFSSLDVEELTMKLEKSLRRIGHLNELLHEAEGGNQRLSEQNKLLKGEIRRLEQNEEREKHLANIEYLKNVFLKFMAPQVANERRRLIPVLTTMLRLSQDEVTLLNSAVVSAGDEDDGQSTQTSAWNSYLHRWSGVT